VAPAGEWSQIGVGEVGHQLLVAQKGGDEGDVAVAREGLRSPSGDTEGRTRLSMAVTPAREPLRRRATSPGAALRPRLQGDQVQFVGFKLAAPAELGPDGLLTGNSKQQAAIVAFTEARERLLGVRAEGDKAR
jgi:hypothetical protein